MEAKPDDNKPTQDAIGINTANVLPTPVLPVPVLSTPVLPAPVIPAPVIPATVLPAPVIPAPVIPPAQPLPGQAPQIQWMPQPSTIIGCPPGLEYLTQLDQILVHQQVELLEAFTALETENRYHIKNTLGQQIFFAQEESDPLRRQQLRSYRNFTMHVVNNVNQEVIRVVRPSQLCDGLFTVAVEAPPGHPIGHVRRRVGCFSYCFEVLDASLNPVLKIREPGFSSLCASDINFLVMTPDDSQQVGRVTKQWAGQVQEFYTTADNFCITFPMDLDVKVKSTLLGALFLIDFMFFESRPR